MKRATRTLLMALTLMVALQSCYSIKIACKQCVADPDPTNQDQASFHQKVVSVDKATQLGIFQGNAWLVEPCGTKGFYSVEVSVNLRMVIANTFRKKKFMKIKYVCVKE